MNWAFGNNPEIRLALKKHGIKHYQLADRLGIRRTSLSRILSEPLPIWKRDKLLKVIEDMAEEYEEQ